MTTKMKEKMLDAAGKGEYSYNYEHDILTFRVKEREYSRSVEFDNIVLDLDKNGYIVGVRIFDANKIFKISKYALNRLKEWEFQTRIDTGVIFLELRFTATLRNKQIITQGEHFVRELADSSLENSVVNCTA